MYAETDYQRERAICDKAEAYARATMAGKRNYLTKEECAHPDYAACNNDMRGRVETYELHRDKPDAFCTYVQESTPAQRQQTNVEACRRRSVTTWVGNVLGNVTHTGAWVRSGFGGAKWRPVVFVSEWGRTYYGREYNTMQLVRFRAYKNREG